MSGPRETYERGRERRAREVAALDARSRTIAGARLALAAAAIGLVGAIVWVRSATWAPVALGAVVVAFVALVIVHARVIDERARSAAALRFHERGLARLAHAWDSLPRTSARFRAADHPFAADLDVFGRASVAQLVDSTETLFGERALARWLSLDSPGAWPDDVRARQQAVRELSGRPELREALATAGGVFGDDRPDPEPFLAWAEARESLPAWLPWVGWAVPGAAGASIAAGEVVHATTGAIAALALLAMAIGIATATRVARTLEVASARESTATRWRAMIAAIERESFESPLLVELQRALAGSEARASDRIGALERIVGFAEARRNEAFRFLIGPLLMWDVHCAVALDRWRAKSGASVRAWLDAVGRIEALASLGGFAFEHPDFAWPDFAADPSIEARGLGHPLIAGDKRVGNDVTIPSAGRALVVTGSNMSGKSTLLRAIGVNAVLAFAGAPVCARSMRLGPARVATSMRISDSLEEGVSRFYAELRRIKRVLDLARAQGDRAAPVLFLFDEILHGTNSRERVIGACAVVRELLSLGALGAITTHDLGITALAKELPGVVENVHFQEQVEGDAMTFDYVLRPGVVQSSNALRLMRAVGIGVDAS